MARNTGLGGAGSELLRVTAEPVADVPPVEGEEQGGQAESNASRARRRKPATTAGKTKPRNVRLTDDVHDRLWLLARQRKQTVSAVANALLDSALPKWEIRRQA